ncbi:MAG: hypothetical protein DCC73_11855 [Proteobacteria bacterium]|nr:MAG: hypothetical protein DCC73_11855 [Pseudomonadota bacterium]
MRVPPPIIAAIAAGGLSVGGVSFYEHNEGMKLQPYRDVTGTWTVCAGLTQVEMRAYTAEECRQMTVRAVQEAGHAVETLTPAAKGNNFYVAALADFYLNVGRANYLASTAHKRFSDGDPLAGCLALGPYIVDYQTGVARSGYIHSKGSVINGLKNRRLAEMDVCLRGYGS